MGFFEFLRQRIRYMVAVGISLFPRGLFIDKKFFELYQSKGWHCTPVHFYQPIPNTTHLADSLWQSHSALIGIDMNAEEQLRLLSEVEASYLKRYHRFPLHCSGVEHDFHRSNRGFGGLGGAMYYSFIKKYRPAKIIEIGAGSSTKLAARALLENAEEDSKPVGDLTAIDPYPRNYLIDGFPGLKRLDIRKVQDVPLAEFESLNENDILFIDSSHVCRVGSDVNFEILEILPRLRKGVLVHFHDIYLPLEYPKEMIKERYIFWTEQYMLQAFLAFNTAFKVLWGASYMNLYYHDALRNVFKGYDFDERKPAFIWLQRCS